MNRKISIILALLLLLAGIGVFIYPTLSDYLSRIHGSYAIQELSGRMDQVGRETLDQQRRLAEAYNAQIAGGVFGADTQVPENYEDILDFGGGMMGSIRIPKIDVDLPIYHGVSDAVLSKGVGHMPQSGFPIGGMGNHAVLSSHTGLPSAELFTDLTELETGDIFYICILEEVLAYQVDQIKVVLPSETDDLAPVPGEDHCTLVTCTPYGINSHRLLVRGTRLELAHEEAEEQLQAQLRQEMALPWELIVAAVAAGGILIGIAVLLIRKRRE